MLVKAWLLNNNGKTAIDLTGARSKFVCMKCSSVYVSRAPKWSVQVAPIAGSYFFWDIPNLMSTTETDHKDSMKACIGNLWQRFGEILLHLGHLEVTLSLPFSGTGKLRGSDLAFPALNCGYLQWSLWSQSLMLGSKHCKGSKKWATGWRANPLFLLLEVSWKFWAVHT